MNEVANNDTPQPVKRKPGWPYPGPGRPKGVIPKVKQEIASECRKHADKALRTLIALLGEKNEGPVRLGAARELLDRGFGRPHQSVSAQIDVNVEVNGARNRLEQRLHKIIELEAVEPADREPD